MSPRGKFSQFVQLALNGFCYRSATAANERRQTIAFGDWHQKKLTKKARKVDLQLHRAEQGGVLWGYLCQANVARTKPLEDILRKIIPKCDVIKTVATTPFFFSHAINAKGPGYEANVFPSTNDNACTGKVEEHGTPFIPYSVIYILYDCM